jgi:hypothetical protein
VVEKDIQVVILLFLLEVLVMEVLVVEEDQIIMFLPIVKVLVEKAMKVVLILLKDMMEVLAHLDLILITTVETQLEVAVVLAQ